MRSPRSRVVTKDEAAPFIEGAADVVESEEESDRYAYLGFRFSYRRFRPTEKLEHTIDFTHVADPFLLRRCVCFTGLGIPAFHHQRSQSDAFRSGSLLAEVRRRKWSPENSRH